MPMTGARPMWGAMAMATIVAALMGSCSSKPQCKVDNDCGPARACVKEMCLPRGAGTLAFEITPAIDSLSAPTEIVGFTSEMTTFPVDRKVSVIGEVTQPDPLDKSLYSPEGHVAVTIPSRIPGREALSVQSDMVDFSFNFAIGASHLGESAVITFTQVASVGDQPPIPLPATLSPTLALSFPTAEQRTYLRGQLQDVAGQPLVGFLVRAFLDSTRVSNLDVTTATGGFTPWIPSSVLTPKTAVILTMDLMETVNPDDMRTVPQYVSLPFVPPAAPLVLPDGTTAAHIYKMPAYTASTQPIPFVVVAGDDHVPQSGVMVRFRAEIASPPDGVAVFKRSAMTDKDGLVYVPLIGDGQGGALAYQVALQSPSTGDFHFASRCMPSVPIDLSQANAPQPTLLVMDTRRSVLGGHVFGKGSGGADVTVADAQVTATQILAAGACTDAMTAQTSTDGKGSYVLQVDPGTYRIDVIPPTTSQWPRLTQDGDSATVVDASFVQHDIWLPQGQVVDGTVIDADGLALPNATVRIFETDCETAADCPMAGPPKLLAEVKTDAVTDGDKKVIGTFRAVLPAR